MQLLVVHQWSLPSCMAKVEHSLVNNDNMQGELPVGALSQDYGGRLLFLINKMNHLRFTRMLK